MTYSNRPEVGSTALGFWWLWYDGSMRNEVGINNSPALVAPVQAAVDGGRPISFRWSSPGYRTEYRSREHATASERPMMIVHY